MGKFDGEFRHRNSLACVRGKGKLIKIICSKGGRNFLGLGDLKRVGISSGEKNMSWRRKKKGGKVHAPKKKMIPKRCRKKQWKVPA